MAISSLYIFAFSQFLSPFSAFSLAALKSTTNYLSCNHTFFACLEFRTPCNRQWLLNFPPFRNRKLKGKYAYLDLTRLDSILNQRIVESRLAYFREPHLANVTCRILFPNHWIWEEGGPKCMHFIAACQKESFSILFADRKRKSLFEEVTGWDGESSESEEV